MNHSLTNTKYALELFNEKISKLDELSFTQRVKSVKTGITISSKRIDENSFNTTVERRGPTPESVDAFVLTLRLFLQDNEPISIRRLSEHYSQGFFSNEIETEFRDIRSTLNRYLEESHEMYFDELGRILTRREMMEMFLYGDLAHTNNEENRNRFTHWTEGSDVKKELAFNEFIVIISRVLIALWWIRDLNKRALAEIE